MSDGPDGRFYSRVFALVTAALLALAVFRMLQPFIGAILWSVLLAFLLHPANRDLRRVLGGRPAAAAFLLTVAVIALIVLPAVMLAGAFASQAGDLFRRLQQTAGHYQIAR